MNIKLWMQLCKERNYIEVLTDKSILIKDIFWEDSHNDREWFNDIIIKNKNEHYQVYSISQLTSQIEFYEEFEDIRDYLTERDCWE